MAVTTLLDIAKANGSDAAVGLIEEVLTYSPEVRLIPARTIKGMQFKTLVRTALPGAAFRNANEGVTPTKSTWENRVVECFILNPKWVCDKAVADKYEDGAEAFIALEAEGILRASIITLGSQFYYGAGTGGDAKGCPGLIQSYDATNMVVDAGGTTASTGSSVWAVKYGPKEVQWCYGQDGALEVSDPRVEDAYDASNNPYTAYKQELMAYPGLQVGTAKAIGRIKKLTADSGKGLTDALISQLLGKFAVGFKPDVLFMSRRSLMQLQASRTATSPSGSPAPIPAESLGVRIEVTDSILDTESLTL